MIIRLFGQRVKYLISLYVKVLGIKGKKTKKKLE